MSKKDGGPAFPINRADFKQDGTLASSAWDTGMSLRDWFAGQAIVGLLASEIETASTYQQSARTAYEMADAMLKARESQ